MPITGSRASDRCETCVRDRTECGNCKYLTSDRRHADRRQSYDVDNFIAPGAPGAEYEAEARQAS